MLQARGLGGLGFVFFLHDPKPRLSLGDGRHEPKLAQDINHGALDAGLCTNISHVPSKQKFRDSLLSPARLIGALTARLRAVARPAAPRRRLEPLSTPLTLQFRHAFRHVTVLSFQPG